MLSILLVLIQIAALYLLADFAGGLFHWAEDTLGGPDTPLWGRIFVQPSDIHHARPTEMVKIPWIINNIPIALGTLAALALAWALGALCWQLWVFAAVACWNQQVHRFSHLPRHQLPAVVKWLQRWRILQTPREHWMHHTRPHTSHYCVLTPWLNPLLDRTGFWRGLERVLVPIFGAPRRPDLINRHWYRA